MFIDLTTEGWGILENRFSETPRSQADVPVFKFHFFSHWLCGFEQVTCSSPELSSYIYINHQCCLRCVLWNTSPVRYSLAKKVLLKLGDDLNSLLKALWTTELFNFALPSRVCYLIIEVLFRLTRSHIAQKNT